MERSHTVPAAAVGLFALVGAAFSVVSTYDFINHLDRQVHSIHCGFFPGTGVDVAGASGCHTVMMSPYSSLLRTDLWGGLPISLLSLGVFAYLVFRAADLLIRRATGDADETRYLVAATALPVVMTLVYGSISVFVIDAVCTNCVGIYVSSLGGFLAALILHRGAKRAEAYGSDEDEYGYEASPGKRYALYFAEGLAFVALPVIAFLMMRPDYSTLVSGCGELARPDDANGILVELHPNLTGTPAIEVLDPLCPACRAFDTRLGASGLEEQLHLRAVLFPLDSTCNWMVSSAIHPGACMVSEAVLCSAGDAERVLSWAFANQEHLKELAAADLGSLEAEILKTFPGLKRCLGSKGAKFKLNQSLRWAVDNRLPVLTPQLYVDGKKICDEDTDLGLDYALHRMLSGLDGSVMGDETTGDDR